MPTDFIPSLPSDPGVWVSGHTYGALARTRPVTPNGLIYQTTSGGVAGVSEPTWPLVVGNTVVDGGLTWTCTGMLALYATGEIGGYPIITVPLNGDTGVPQALVTANKMLTDWVSLTSNIFNSNNTFRGTNAFIGNTSFSGATMTVTSTAILQQVAVSREFITGNVQQPAGASSVFVPTVTVAGGGTVAGQAWTVDAGYNATNTDLAGIIHISAAAPGAWASGITTFFTLSAGSGLKYAAVVFSVLSSGAPFLEDSAGGSVAVLQINTGVGTDATFYIQNPNGTTLTTVGQDFYISYIAAF